MMRKIYVKNVFGRLFKPPLFKGISEGLIINSFDRNFLFLYHIPLVKFTRDKMNNLLPGLIGKFSGKIILKSKVFLKIKSMENQTFGRKLLIIPSYPAGYYHIGFDVEKRVEYSDYRLLYSNFK
jgi:hypothetical protein